jgi:hypothetical protein
MKVTIYYVDDGRSRCTRLFGSKDADKHVGHGEM